MSARTASTLVWLALIVTVVVAMAAIASALLAPGSLSPATDAANALPAPELAATADEIRPIIAIVDAFRSRAPVYPLLSDDLAGALPQGVLVDDIGDTMSFDIGGGRVWVYAREPDGEGYQLTRKLPDGGSLIRIQDSGRAVWRYTPDQDDDPTDTAIPP